MRSRDRSCANGLATSDRYSASTVISTTWTHVFARQDRVQRDSGPGRNPARQHCGVSQAMRRERDAAENARRRKVAKDAERGFAQPHRLFQHRVEHRRQIAGRSVDNLQHLGGRGLLLQRLLLFGDQPRVFDRDHRLIGEGADKLDLPVGERLDPLAREHDEPDHVTFAQQRHAKRGPLLAQGDRSSRVVWIGGNIVNMHDAALKRGSRADTASFRAVWPNRPEPCPVFRRITRSQRPPGITRPRDGRGWPYRHRKAVRRSRPACRARVADRRSSG